MYKQFIKFIDTLYVLNRRVLDDPKYTGEVLDDMMKLYKADKVLRKDGFLYFLELVEEAHVIDWLPKED